MRRFLERSGVLFLLTSAVNAGTLALAGLLVAAGVLGAPGPVLLGLVPGVVGVLVIGRLRARCPTLARRAARRGQAAPARCARPARIVQRHARRAAPPDGWRLAGAIAYLWADIAMLLGVLPGVRRGARSAR